MAVSPGNNVERAYAALRSRAVTFAVKPGTRLNESELAVEFGMSRAPIREALNRLVADGFVHFEHGKGFYCRRLSVVEITDLFATRLDLELGALRQTVVQASDASIGELRDWWAGVEARQQDMQIELLVEDDEAFHMKLAAIAGNQTRQNYLEKINDRVRFVRRINLEDKARRAVSLADHALLLDAVARRDLASASLTLSQHLTLTAEEARRQVDRALARIYADEVA